MFNCIELWIVVVLPADFVLRFFYSAYSPADRVIESLGAIGNTAEECLCLPWYNDPKISLVCKCVLKYRKVATLL